MTFKELTDEKKQELHIQLLSYATSMGGKNFFLQMIEQIRDNKQNPLLAKEKKFNYKKGSISWNKTIYKDTYAVLYSAMRKEEKDGDMLDNLKPKDYKNTMNMMKALKPITLEFKPRNMDELEGFELSILDATEEKKTKVSLLFKIIFFYNLGFTKEVLAFEKQPD